MGSANRHERNNGTQQRKGVFFAVRGDILKAGQVGRDKSIREESWHGS
jgi:hypothetical protein